MVVAHHFNKSLFGQNFKVAFICSLSADKCKLDLTKLVRSTIERCKNQTYDCQMKNIDVRQSAVDSRSMIGRGTKQTYDSQIHKKINDSYMYKIDKRQLDVEYKPSTIIGPTIVRCRKKTHDCQMQKTDKRLLDV